MNSQESGGSECRICLENSAELDWDDLLSDYSQLTYKDCYFKYTELKYSDDSFPAMLCRTCSNGLEYIDSFISKALESHVILQERLHINMIIKDDKTDIKYEAPHFETMLGATDIDPEISIIPSEELHTVPAENYTCSISESFTTLTQTRKPEKRKPVKIPTRTNKIDDKKHSSVSGNKDIPEPENAINNPKELSTNQNVHIDLAHFIDIENFESSVATLLKQQHIKKCDVKLPKSLAIRKYIKKRNKYQALLTTSFQKKRSKSATTNKTENDGKTYESLKQKINENCGTESVVPSNINQAARPKENKILLCQYCSLKVKGTNQLKMHEATHCENRKRTETCPKCGVKLYTKSTLNEHIKIHDENRQKNYKCEFCEKSFFNKGTLNVHKRIHLGLMVKCQICPKEFFRKTDLEKHMNSHSATLINVEPRKRSRYLVRCKYCNKNILSTSFKSHIAAHLNDPLMKCSICSKEFFRRRSCTDHLKSVHKKTTDEYNHFIILYKKKRLSHLFLEQTAELQLDAD